MKTMLKTVLAGGVIAMALIFQSMPADAADMNDVYSEYAEFVNRYKVAQDHQFYANDLSNPAAKNINMILQWGYESQLYYTLVDISRDGVPELFIAGNVYEPIQTNGEGWRVNGYVVYDTYGYSNSEASRLFDDLGIGYRSNYSLMQNNVILHSASGGAFNNVLEYYTLPGNSHTPQMKQFVEFDAFDGVTKWYLGTNDYNKKQLISKATRDSVVNNYRYKGDFNWHPISDLASLRTELLGEKIPIFLNGEKLACDQPPVIVNGRTMVPLRAIFEGLGASVDWNNATRTVTSTLDGTTVEMTVDSATMIRNGQVVLLDVPAQIINDRTMVPIRAVAEAFGAKVVWDQDARKVYVTK